MAVISELGSYGIYGTQQLGVMLGVGAETVVLVLLLLAVHGSLQGTLGSLASPARVVRAMGLFLIIVSGLLAVALHVSAGATEVLFAPAFLFKWALVALVLLLHLAERWSDSWGVIEGVAGGSWYALFLVHILAPATTWGNLIMLYVAWTVCFGVLWASALFFMKRTLPVPAMPPR